MKKAADYFFFSSFFISCCAFALVWETYLLAGILPHFRVAYLIFFATFFLYNFDGLLPYKTAQQIFISEKKTWLMAHRKFLTGLSILAGFGCLYFCWQLSAVLSVYFLLPFFLVSVLYSMPLLPSGNRRIPLRDIPYLKVFLIAGVWAGLTVLLPLLTAGKNIAAPDFLLLSLRRFLFIFALTLLFDIRDRKKDAQAGTITFPVKSGTSFTKNLAFTALILFALLVHFQETGAVKYALAGSAVAAALVVYFTEENRPEYFFATLADGMMLLQFLIVWYVV